MRTIIEVEVTNISVDDYYFSFNYKVIENGKLKKQGEYQSDHAWADDVKSFKALLKSSEAVKLALEEAF